MIGGRSENAQLQSDFYRDQYRKILRWVMAATFIILALVAIIIYLTLFRSPQEYYANTIEGRIIPMPPGISNGS